LEKAKNEYFYYRDRWIYTPTGKLKLTLVSDNQYNPYAALTDGSSSLIEDRIENIASIVLAKAADRQVKKEMDEEESVRREAAWAKHQELAQVRDAELARLEKMEKKAVKWRRAQELRAFACALERATVGTSNERAERVIWIQNAADWLDPLIKKCWPAVDIDAEG